MEIAAMKTWFDRHHGVVSVTDDVLGVVRDLKAIDDRLHVFYNEQTGRFDVVEHCLDGVQRLVCSVAELDQRVVNRIRMADHWGGNDTPDRFVLDDDSDFATKIDSANDQLEASWRKTRREALQDAGERFAWAMDLPLKGNVGKGESIHVKRSIS